MFLMRTCSLLAAIAFLVPAVPAQTCSLTNTKADGGPFYEAWVDPIRGVDAFYNPTTNPNISHTAAPTVTVAQAQARPFLTIQFAIDEIAALMPNGDEGIVHLNPGIYSPPCQTFPIRMKQRINVQGVGARECVLRGGGPMTVHWPVLKNCLCYGVGPENCKGLVSTTSDVIVDYSLSRFNGDDYAEMIDGVTFQGGTVQVYCRAETQAHGRISNCVFELYRYGDPLPAGPLAGVLLVHIWDDIPEAFHKYEFFLLNNTFIQGWQPTASVKWTANPSNVAVCDVGDPFCQRLGPLQGVGNVNMANNIIRSLSTDLRTATLGISDAECRVNGTDCNMFNGPALLHPGDSFSPANSLPWEDPAFVGEMLTNFFGVSQDRGRDWRVLPDSVVREQGQGPTAGTLTFDSLDSLGNQIVYTEPSTANDCTWTPIDSFDFDGEGYGNRRVIGSIDLGFDEFEFLVDSGFGNDSLAIPSTANPCTISGPAPCNGNPVNPCYCVPTGGTNLHRLIMAKWGSGHILPTVTLRDKSAACPTGTYSIHPGALLPPTISGSNVFWFASPFTTVTGLTPTLHSTYVPPDSISMTPHQFTTVNRTSANSGTFRLFQAKIGTTWSNLQPSFD